MVFRVSEIYASAQVSVGNTFALVDEDDLELVSQYTWFLLEGAKGGIYANTFFTKDGKRSHILMHQLIMGTKGVDHRDGNGLNNTRANLRVATASENQVNGKKRKSLSKYKGVSLVYTAQKGDRWKARINKEGRRYFLGYYDSEEAAARAYDQAARDLYGEFATLNFPRANERKCE